MAMLPCGHEENQGFYVCCCSPCYETMKAKAALEQELVDACKSALVSLRGWNGMGFTDAVVEEGLWQLYRNSPDIKVLESVIAKAAALEAK